ncbi:jg16828 [Pararge aegeria aegeria]|uniref:Jg16828 protein n=1 Tax=Pararge aegeria aegeria TaxID=348720 RepID=A0A8S4SDY6_9NEOP|nr:jg16828 [Pararge aegeria aegeria]
MEAGRTFQILAVRIRNEDAKRFLRVRYIDHVDPYGVSRLDGKKARMVKLEVVTVVTFNVFFTSKVNFKV